jgi:hypothetical protein
LFGLKGIQQLLCVRVVPSTKRIVLARRVVYINLGNVLVGRQEVHDLGILQIRRYILQIIDAF